MSTLDAYARFLTARWDEMEQAARGAIPEGTYPHYGDTAAGEVLAMAESEGCAAEGIAHFRLHVPAYVLADLAAKRAILEEALDYSPELEHGDNGEWAFETVIRALAEPFCDHPDHPDHPANQEQR